VSDPIEISASRVTLHGRCPRAWGYRYLDQLPETAPAGDGAAAMARGKLLHGALEHAIRAAGAAGATRVVLSGQDLDAGLARYAATCSDDESAHATDVQAVLAGLAPLDCGAPILDPETRWSRDYLGGDVTLTGVFDLVVLDDEETVRVVDWKSGQIPDGDPAWTPQVLAYLVATRERWGGTGRAPSVELRYLEQGTRVLTRWTPELDARGRALLLASAQAQRADRVRHAGGKPPRARPGSGCASCGYRDRCDAGARWLAAVAASTDAGLGDADLLARRRDLAGVAALAERRRRDLDEEVRKRLGRATRLEAGGLVATLRSRRTRRLPVAALLDRLSLADAAVVLEAATSDLTLERVLKAAPAATHEALRAAAVERVSTYVEVREV
jgi:RecB family exonuclease